MNDLAVKHRVYINAAVPNVFQLLTSGDGWSKWFTRRSHVDPRPGGEIRLEWVDFGPDHTTVCDQGRVVEIVPDKVLSFTWRPGTHDTLVKLRFEPRGSGCIIDLEEIGYQFDPEDIAVALQVATGWGEALTLLKFYIEAGLVYGPVPRA